MNRWLNRSHPQTLQAGVLLGYFSGVLSLLGRASGGIGLLLAIGLIGGSFGVANSKRIGYYVLAVAATIRVLHILQIGSTTLPAGSLSRTIILTLILLTALVFPIALVVAVLHSHSRTYQQAWFD